MTLCRAGMILQLPFVGPPRVQGSVCTIRRWNMLSGVCHTSVGRMARELPILGVITIFQGTRGGAHAAKEASARN